MDSIAVNEVAVNAESGPTEAAQIAVRELSRICKPVNGFWIECARCGEQLGGIRAFHQHVLEHFPELGAKPQAQVQRMSDQAEKYVLGEWGDGELAIYDAAPEYNSEADWWGCVAYGFNSREEAEAILAMLNSGLSLREANCALKNLC